MRCLPPTVLACALLTTHALAHHPPSNEHEHPHNTAHPRSEDRSRFITNRESDVTLDLPSEEDSFFFIVFGDRTGGPAEGVKVLAEAVDDTNLLEPDFVMTVGDLVEGYNNREQWMAQMREFTGIMDGLLCPWFPVAGNHDIYWRPNADAPPEEHEGDYEMHFGPLWYAFEHKNCWFIVLYSDEPNPDTGERNFNKPECQVMSDEQFNWLKDTLTKTADADHVFVFLHHPRWLGGQYGDDWQKVHAELVRAGNVTAVFAGHIHYMRYDGPHDGIEYVTLATVGGAQSNVAPTAGFLHQFHTVTVRKNQVAMASLPVGEVMDVRAITGTVARESAALARTQPQFAERVRVERDGSAAGAVTSTFTNPTSRPIDIEVIPESTDSRWRFAPDHAHATIEPGETAQFTFESSRRASVLDPTFRSPTVRIKADYLADAARYAMPDTVAALPLLLDLPAPPRPAGATERVLAVNGRDQCARVAADLLEIDPDSPLTLECWFKADSFADRTGLVAKTENSDYGFFVNRGVPSFSIFLGDRYTEVRASEPILQTGTWHHIAGVYDGNETRLYVDGRLIARERKRATRRTNQLPLFVGADVDGRGNPMSHFDGMIDGVRLSDTARYAGESFTPERRVRTDEQTVLLLNMDGVVLSQWLFDESGRYAHPDVVGAQVVEAH